MDNIVQTEKKKRTGKIDRKDSQFSEQDFLDLPRSEQLRLADEYLNRRANLFDDGTFKFSRSHFADICKKIGLRKGIVDDRAKDLTDQYQDSIIWIEHGKRKETEVKKMTLSTETIRMMDELLSAELANSERSKVIDNILGSALKKLLADKASGRFQVCYRPIEAKRLM